MCLPYLYLENAQFAIENRGSKTTINGWYIGLLLDRQPFAYIWIKSISKNCIGIHDNFNIHFQKYGLYRNIESRLRIYKIFWTSVSKLEYFKLHPSNCDSNGTSIISTLGCSTVVFFSYYNDNIASGFYDIIWIFSSVFTNSLETQISF